MVLSYELQKNMPSNFSQILAWCFQDFGFLAQANMYSKNKIMLEKPISIISYTVFEGGWSSMASNLDESAAVDESPI